MSTAHDLLHDFQHVIDDITIVTGSNGIFDVTADGVMLFSKHAAGRHARPGEIRGLFRDAFAQDVEVYER